MNIKFQLEKLKIALETYYETDFMTDEEDIAANTAIKYLIADVVIAANAADDMEVKQNALDTLAMSTGCAEDYKILTEITESLIDLGIITEATALNMFEKAPTNRWF